MKNQRVGAETESKSKSFISYKWKLTKDIALKPNLALQSSLGPGAELFWVLNQRLAIWQSNPISCDPKWFILGLGFEPQRGRTGVGVHFGACLGHVGGYIRALLGQVGPDWGVESNLNQSLLGWGWIGLHFGSMLRPPWGCLLGSCVTVSGSLRLAFLARRAKAKIHLI